MYTEFVASRPISVALVAPPSSVDYADNIESVLAAGSPSIDTIRVDPTTNPAPTLDMADLVIVTGSTANVGDANPWIEALANYLHALVDSGTPVLGVCFGHQLLASSLGGTVETLPERAAGYRPITATDTGCDHPLLADLPASFTSFVWHHDYVADPPPSATVTARNETGIQAFACIDRPAYGIQFHPEVALEDAHTLINSWPQTMLPPDVTETLTNVAVTRAARTRRIYANAVSLAMGSISQ